MDHTYCVGCGKRCYSSPHAIRQAFRRASFRLRWYFCRDACAYHVTNTEKR